VHNLDLEKAALLGGSPAEDTPRQRLPIDQKQEVLSMSEVPLRPTGGRLLPVVTAINVLVAAGFAIAGLVAPAVILPSAAPPDDASTIFALYAAARAIPLAIVTLAVIYRRETSTLVVLGALAAIIQLFDASIGWAQHDVGKTLGPLVIAVAQAASLWQARRFR
jgi:hypothetical protein